jgi:nucleotide-binding universal stress UspA family protein
MFELSTILTPLDGSSGSLSALAMAEHLASAYRAKVQSTHIVETIPDVVKQVLFPYAALGEDLAEFESELVTTAQRELREQYGKREGKESQHPVRVSYSRLVEGLHAELVVTGPDLVVMGAYGHGGSKNGQLGSTAQRIAELWEGPLLLVRHLNRETPIERVLVCTDFAPGCETLMTAGAGVATRTNTPMSVITVVQDPRKQDAGGLVSGALRIDPEKLLSQGRKSAEIQFDRVMSEIEIPHPDQEAFSDLHGRLFVKVGDPSEQLNELLADRTGTLMVVGRSGGRPTSSGLGRTAESLLRRVAAHVLIVPL